MFNEPFYRLTIVDCIVDTIYFVLAGINLVISEAACSLKKDPSVMLLVQSCIGKKFFKVLIFLPNIYPCVLLFDLQKRMIIEFHSQATLNFTLLSLFIIIAKNIKKFISILKQISFKLFVLI